MRVLFTAGKTGIIGAAEKAYYIFFAAVCGIIVL